jgi:hypothetical protein
MPPNWQKASTSPLIPKKEAFRMCNTKKPDGFSMVLPCKNATPACATTVEGSLFGTHYTASGPCRVVVAGAMTRLELFASIAQGTSEVIEEINAIKREAGLELKFESLVFSPK